MRNCKGNHPLTVTRISLVLLSILLGSCQGGRKEPRTDAAEISLARISLSELDGKAVDIATFEGKTVFVNFWATWCKPCIQEMPTIARLQESLKDENIIFLFASNEESNEIENFAKKRGFPFHYVKIENLEELNIQALPTTFIFDRAGQLRFSEAGYRSWDDPENLTMINAIINHAEK